MKPVRAWPSDRATDPDTLVDMVPTMPATFDASAKPTIQLEPSLSYRVRTGVAHALRDYLGQGLGRLASTGAYCSLATLDEFGLRVAAGMMGAVIGGRLAYRIAEAQIGNATRYQQAGVAFCTLLGAAAGGTISALGSNQIISGIAACTLLTAGASLANRSARTAEERERAEGLKLGAATFGLAGGTFAASLDPAWKLDSRLLPARNLGLIVESTVIELCKSSLERLGPSVDRDALNFEGRIMVALTGMLPYVAATVVLNGYVAGWMQPGYDSNRFQDLIGPTLVGAIANGVRGASNALAASLLQRQQRFMANDGRDCLRAGQGVRWPQPRAVSDKACVRFFLSACRNGVYARLRDAHLGVTEASMIAQAVYACFAQCRELIADLIRGDGWTEPQLLARLPTAGSAIDENQL